MKPVELRETVQVKPIGTIKHDSFELDRKRTGWD